MGGPSVKPPQPAGLWEAVGYTGSNTAQFAADSGAEKVHRRSLYTFWKRTSPPPQMTTLDAPSREACQVRRERTNTPLQALLLLNEPQFVEASRALAERTLREAGSTTDDRLSYMFRLAASRLPDAKDLVELTGAFQDFAAHYTKQADAAKAADQPRRDEARPPLQPRRACRLDDDRQRDLESRRSDDQGLTSRSATAMDPIREQIDADDAPALFRAAFGNWPGFGGTGQPAG